MWGRNNSANIHAWVEARLSEYLDNRLAANEHARVEQHLSECAECRASFESLHWTMALVKQAPAPALPRAFTLPVPEKHVARPSLAFGFAQFATVLATLLLIAVIGVDLITQFGGGMMASAPSVAKQYAAPATAAPAVTSATQDQALEVAKPAAAPKPVEPPQPAAPPAAPKPTMAPQPTSALPAAALPAPMNVLPTPTAPRNVGGTAPGVTETKGMTDTTTATSLSATPAFRSGLTITATATLSAPTQTATSVPPTATVLPSPTLIAQARVEATRAPTPTQVPPALAQPLLTPLRAVEVGLLILALFFGAMVVVMWRRR